MEWFMDLVSRYAYIVILGLQLLLTMLVLRMGYSIRRTNRTILEIRSKVAGYLEVILQEPEEEEEWHKTPKQEELMRASIENRKKQQQEAVFNAVLKEIFP